MKNTCINPSAVALPVFSKTQIVSAKAAHIGGKHRDDLSQPDKCEAEHSRWTICILHLFLELLNKVPAG